MQTKVECIILCVSIVQCVCRMPVKGYARARGRLAVVRRVCRTLPSRMPLQARVVGTLRLVYMSVTWAGLVAPFLPLFLLVPLAPCWPVVVIVAAVDEYGVVDRDLLHQEALQHLFVRSLLPEVILVHLQLLLQQRHLLAHIALLPAQFLVLQHHSLPVLVLCLVVGLIDPRLHAENRLSRGKSVA